MRIERIWNVSLFRASVVHVLFRCLLYNAFKIANELMNSFDSRVSIVESLNIIRSKNSDEYVVLLCGLGVDM